jgi:hypothetical protein
LKYTVSMNFESAEAYYEELKPRVTKTAFLAACNEWSPARPGNGQNDGLDEPIYRTEVDKAKARVKAEELYTKIIDKARSKRDAQAKQKAAADEAEQKKLSALAAERPSNMLVNLIDKRIGERDAARGNADDTMNGEEDHLEWEEADEETPQQTPPRRYTSAADTVLDLDAEQFVGKVASKKQKK